MTEETFTENLRSLEAILFTMGDSVESEVLKTALELSEEEFDDLMAALIRKYEAPDSGLQIIRLEDAYQMCTRKDCYEALIKVASVPVKPNLTGVMLEVLSIIAYRQPVTRGEIERIRGVSSDYAVNRLLDYGLIEEDGRAETIGRPILFRTSEAFLRQFGFSSAQDLPPIDEETKAQARENAFEEAGATEEERAMFWAREEAEEDTAVLDEESTKEAETDETDDSI